MRFRMKASKNAARRFRLIVFTLLLGVHQTTIGAGETAEPRPGGAPAPKLFLKCPTRPSSTRGARSRAGTTSCSWSNGSTRVASTWFRATTVSGAGCSATRSFHWSRRTSISTASSPMIRGMPRPSGFTPDYCITETTVSGAGQPEPGHSTRARPGLDLYVTRALVQLGRRQSDRRSKTATRRSDRSSVGAIVRDPGGCVAFQEQSAARPADLELAFRLDPTNPSLDVNRLHGRTRGKPGEWRTTILKVSAAIPRRASDPADRRRAGQAGRRPAGLE